MRHLAMIDETLGAWVRLARYQRWGGRVLDIKYVQPAIGPGLARDRGLCLPVQDPRLLPVVHESQDGRRRRRPGERYPRRAEQPWNREVSRTPVVLL